MTVLVLACAVAGVGTSFGAGRSADASTAAAADAGNLDVTDYDVTMNYQPDSSELQASTVVKARATTALERFTLHLSGLTVRSITVDSKPAMSYERTGDKDLVIVPAKKIARGAAFEVTVTYDGKPEGMWLPTTSGGATAFHGNSSAWFPAHEDANDRAGFHLKATVPDGWSVVSIGRQDPVRRGPTATTFGWQDLNVDPGSIAVSIDRFTVERSVLADGTRVVNAYAPGLQEATKPLADQLPEILRFLATKFGRYPFEDAGNVFVDVSPDAPATAPQTRPVFLGAANKQFMTLDAVVHEQAHQWFGVSTGLGAEEDACLSECFASYAPWLWDEATKGVDLDARYREQVEAKRNVAGFWAEVLYQPGESPGIGIYDKGPLALHALRKQIGDKAFDRLLKQWSQEHRGDYVNWPQFEAFAGKIAGQDLTTFFQAWFRGTTIPADKYLWGTR
jgi:aminopeptidase N